MTTKNFQSGFNMIEILGVMVILAIVGAMAVPRADHTTDENKNGPQHSIGAVKTAHAAAIAELKRFPTVDELSGYMEGVESSASANGVQVSINGTQHTVPTYSDSACNANTQSIGDRVACVGDL
jgi:MSHA pilin protein MshA